MNAGETSGGSPAQAAGGKKPGCLWKTILIVVVVFLISNIYSCWATSPSMLGNSEWGRNLKSALAETGITDVGGVDVVVTLKEQDEDGLCKRVTGVAAWEDFGDDILSRNASVRTLKGDVLDAFFYDNDRIYKISDGDVVYWCLPESNGLYAYDVVSYATGEVLYPKDEETAAEREARQEAFEKEQASITDLMRELEKLGYTRDQSRAVDETLKSVGIGGLTDFQVLVDNKSQCDMCGIYRGHQVNFATEGWELCFAQITGWEDDRMGWYVNWRGKLKYGWHDSKLAFDLYDTHAVEGGYIAKYDPESDSVIPWDEA